MQKKKSERVNPPASAIPAVQIDQKSFLKSKRSVDKIERARNMMFADLEADKKGLRHQRSHINAEEESKGGGATAEAKKLAGSMLGQKKKSVQPPLGYSSTSQIARFKQNATYANHNAS